MAPWCIYISCLERAARSGSGRDSVRGSVGAMNAELSRPDWLATVQSGRKQAQSRVCTPGFILTVTAFTVLFTAWYRLNCIFTYSCYHCKNNNLLVYQLLRLTPAFLCCTAPRTARWIWRSINKIIIIIIIKHTESNSYT